MGICVKCEEVFLKVYGRAPEAMAFCPYRICPLGAHIDHQQGKINGLAIDKGIRIAYSRNADDTVHLKSLNFSSPVRFELGNIPAEKAGDWADYLRGAALQMRGKYALRAGISAVIEGTMPIGGLSSSAAVVIAFLSALAAANEITPDPWEMITMAKSAENEYVGVSCGILDQSCEVLSRKDHLLYLDCRDNSYQLIPWKGPEFKMAVFFSGLERALAGSAYNLRRDECKAAAYSLMAYAGLDYGHFEEAALRDVPVSVYEEYRERLPKPFRKRADHYYGEYCRAEAGAAAWARGDIETYGELVFESGESSITNYECGCPELISLYKIMTETDGIYGGRFSGAGFKGCCMALIDPRKAEDLLAAVEDKYLAAYPALRGKYLGVLCNSADGVKL